MNIYTWVHIIYMCVKTVYFMSSNCAIVELVLYIVGILFFEYCYYKIYFLGIGSTLILGFPLVRNIHSVFLYVFYFTIIAKMS